MNFRALILKVISPKVRVEQIQGILHKLSGSTIFSSFDAKEGYHGIPLHTDSMLCTLFPFEGRQ